MIKEVLLDIIYTIDDYDDKPSQLLFNYLETTEFSHKKKNFFEYEDSDSEELR